MEDDMKVRLSRTLPFAALVLHVLAVPVPAQECRSISATLAYQAKKFAVVVPKTPGMEAQAYDDIGCGVASRNNECATRQGIFDSNAVVFDYLTEEQVPAETAYFVLGTDIRTPQGYGIVAFRDREQAGQFSAGHGGGKVVRWFELVDEKLK
jgi:hypothetical protein